MLEKHVSGAECFGAVQSGHGKGLACRLLCGEHCADFPASAHSAANAERTLLAGKAALRPPSTTSVQPRRAGRCEGGRHTRAPASGRHGRRDADRLAYNMARQPSVRIRQLELGSHPAPRMASALRAPRRDLERRASVRYGCGPPFQTQARRHPPHHLDALHRERARSPAPAAGHDRTAGDLGGRGIRRPRRSIAHPLDRAAPRGRSHV